MPIDTRSSSTSGTPRVSGRRVRSRELQGGEVSSFTE